MYDYASHVELEVVDDSENNKRIRRGRENDNW
jgi:hypothetical protein